MQESLNFLSVGPIKPRSREGRLKQNRQIPGIDLVRFAAACLVVIFHFGVAGRREISQAAGRPVILPWADYVGFGAVGVDIFFVISGFIIAYSAHGASAYTFFRSRVVRLMPAIWIVAPISFVVALVVGMETTYRLTINFVRSLILFPFGPGIDGVYWTLPIEVSFYVLVFTLLAFSRMRHFSVTMGVVGLVSTAYALATAAGVEFPLIPGMAPWFAARCLELLLVTHGCFFALGAFLWLSLLNKMTGARIALMCVLTIGCICGVWNWLHSVSTCLVWFIATVFIVASVVWRSEVTNKTTLARCRLLGLTTYPLYLLHNVVGGAIIGWLVDPVGLAAATTVAITIVLGASLTIAAVIEPALQSSMRRLVDNVRAAWFCVFASGKV